MRPHLTWLASLGGALLLSIGSGFGQSFVTPSRLIDTSMWNLESPNLVNHFRRNRESMFGDPAEAKRGWRRMMRRNGTPVPLPGSSLPDSPPLLPSPGGSSSLLEPVLQGIMRRGSRIAGDSTLGTIRRQSGGAPMSRLPFRAPGLGGEPGFGAGESFRSRVGVRRETRWEAAKKALLGIGSSYVQQDTSSFLSNFSSSATLDLSILRKAVEDDFNQEADVHLDFELMEYRSNFDTIQVRMRWNRSAILEDGTPTRVNTGESVVLLDRAAGFKVKTWLGLPPFGSRDAQLIAQTKAGSPNDLDNDNTDDEGFGKPVEEPVTVIVTDVSTLPLFDYGAVGGGCLSLEGPVSQVLPSGACASGGTIDITFEGPLMFSPVQGTEIRPCGSDLPIEEFGSVGFGGQPSFAPVPNGRSSYAVNIGGTSEFALLEAKHDDSALTLEFRVRRSESLDFPSSVGAACGFGR